MWFESPTALSYKCSFKDENRVQGGCRRSCIILEHRTAGKFCSLGIMQSILFKACLIVIVLREDRSSQQIHWERLTHLEFWLPPDRCFQIQLLPESSETEHRNIARIL